MAEVVAAGHGAFAEPAPPTNGYAVWCDFGERAMARRGLFCQVTRFCFAMSQWPFRRFISSIMRKVRSVSFWSDVLVVDFR